MCTMIKILKATYTDEGILLECWDVDEDSYGTVLISADASEVLSIEGVSKTNARYARKRAQWAIENGKPIAPQTIHWY